MGFNKAFEDKKFMIFYVRKLSKFINMEIDEGKHQEHIAYQLEHYYTKIEDENIIEYGVVDSKPLAPIKSF